MRPRIDRLERLRQFIERLLRRAPPGSVRQPAIMRDAINKGALGTLAAKMRQTLPDGKRNFLDELFADAGHFFVAESQARQGRTILAHDSLETAVEVVAGVHAHRTAPA